MALEGKELTNLTDTKMNSLGKTEEKVRIVFPPNEFFSKTKLPNQEECNLLLFNISKSSSILYHPYKWILTGNLLYNILDRTYFYFYIGRDSAKMLDANLLLIQLGDMTDIWDCS